MRGQHLHANLRLQVAETLKDVEYIAAEDGLVEKLVNETLFKLVVFSVAVVIVILLLVLAVLQRVQLRRLLLGLGLLNALQ